jgi:hypothetical protein
MSVADLDDEQLIALALEAIGDRAPERLRPLVVADVVVSTARGEHRGVEAAIAWAGKGYEHLDRRYRVDSLEPHGAGLLGTGRVEYVWRESGQVGDSSPAFFAFRLRDGLLAGIGIRDDPDAARVALGKAP